MTRKEVRYKPLDTGWQEPSEHEPIIAQIEGVGQVFRRNVANASQLSYEIKDERGETVIMTYEMILYRERVVRVIGFLNEKTGLVGYMGLDTMPEGSQPSDFPHKPISDLSEIDKATIEKELVGVLKDGASEPFFDLDARIHEHGGNPHYRVPKSKQGGWRFI